MSNGKLSEKALLIAQDRYFNDGEDWERCANRVGGVVASSESIVPNQYANKFAEMIYNMDFLPGGRIIRNAGRARGSMFNCYVLPMGDSIEEIGQFMKDALILWSEGGGVGVNLSYLRPRGDYIKGKGGFSSGPVSFLEATDAIARTVECGGSRRAAGLACMRVEHPDIMNFIDAKLIHGTISYFNISVGVTEDFLSAVEQDADWVFKFNQKSYGTIKARDIWNKVISNMVSCAEPGLLNFTNLMSNNSYYYSPIEATNPCLTGETLIYVADGRRYVSIKQLVEEGKDVPVFSFNEKTKKVEVQMMRRPRVTGSGKKILKITLDDGSIIRCTENHKFYMKDGNKKEAQDLIINDRLHHLITNPSDRGYMWLFSGEGGSNIEHRVIASFKEGKDLSSNDVVHHIDYNKLNNSPDNLAVMNKKDHNLLHAKDMLAENNPMNRFPERNWLLKQDHSGSNNGRYKGFTPEKVFNVAVDLSKKYDRRITKEEWQEYCKDNGLPLSRYSIDTYNSFDEMLKFAAEEAGVFVTTVSAHTREYKRYLKLLNETDLDVFFDGGSIYVHKFCELCGERFITKWGLRERVFCSRKCAIVYGHSDEKSRSNFYSYWENLQLEKRNKQLKVYNVLKSKIKREPLKKEWELACKNEGVSFRIRSINEGSNINKYAFKSYRELKEATNFNYKVVSIEEDGYEDVYNGTVDFNHNFYIMTKEETGINKKIKFNHILTSNCGEATLSPYESCDLGSLVLPHFVTGSINTNWKKLEEVIRLAIRFLDNVIDCNKYVLREVDVKAHNGRRIGLGVMGLAEYLFAKKLRYGSPKAILEVDRLIKFIKEISYDESVNLAIEKGAFPKFDSVPYGKAHFVRTLPASLRMKIKEHGIRNVTCMSFAPTGTISLLPEVTSGIEPLFCKAYRRVDRISERVYIHPIYEKLLKGEINENEDGNHWFVDSGDLKPEDHFETQAVVQKHVDGAVSKTINMPKGTTVEQLSKLTLEYINDLKGVTVYVDGSREGQILSPLSYEETTKYMLESKEVATSMDEETTRCSSGKCEI